MTKPTEADWVLQGAADYVTGNGQEYRPVAGSKEEEAYLSGWRSAAHDELVRLLGQARAVARDLE